VSISQNLLYNEDKPQ